MNEPGKMLKDRHKRHVSTPALIEGGDNGAWVTNISASHPTNLHCEPP